MATEDSTYPLVVCDRHQALPRPGYAVCVHVAYDGAAIRSSHEATAEQLGEILCARCALKAGGPTVADLILVCPRCVDEIKASRFPAMH